MKPSRSIMAVLLTIVMSGLNAVALAAPRALSPTFELRSDAMVANADVTIGDLVKISGLTDEERQQVAARRVLTTPPLGQFFWLPRERLRKFLADVEPVSSQAWTGAAVVRIRRDAQTVDASILCRVAQDAVREAIGDLPAGATLHSECESPLAPVLVPAGTARFHAIADRIAAVSGIQDVPIVAECDGKSARTVHVAVRVNLQADLRCAAADVKAGESAVDSGFEPCRRQVTDRRQLRLKDAPPEGLRLKRSIRQGEVLSSADLIDAATPLRGEGVSVVYRIGSIEIVSRGELRQDAKVGEAVHVRLSNSGQTIVGKLAAAQRVEVEELP